MGFFSFFLKTVYCLSLMGYAYGFSFGGSSSEEVTSTTDGYTTNNVLRGLSLYEDLDKIAAPDSLVFINQLMGCRVDKYTTYLCPSYDDESRMKFKGRKMGDDKWHIFAKVNQKYKPVTACPNKQHSEYSLNIKTKCPYLLFFSKREGLYIKTDSLFSKNHIYVYMRIMERSFAPYPVPKHYVVLEPKKDPDDMYFYESKLINADVGSFETLDKIVSIGRLDLPNALAGCSSDRGTGVHVCQKDDVINEANVVLKGKYKGNDEWSIYAEYEGQSQRVRACRGENEGTYSAVFGKKCSYPLYFSNLDGFYIKKVTPLHKSMKRTSVYMRFDHESRSDHILFLDTKTNDANNHIYISNANNANFLPYKGRPIL